MAALAQKFHLITFQDPLLLFFRLSLLHFLKHRLPDDDDDNGDYDQDDHSSISSIIACLGIHIAYHDFAKLSPSIFQKHFALYICPVIGRPFVNIIINLSQIAGPPPPLLGTPYLKKIVWFILHFRP